MYRPNVFLLLIVSGITVCFFCATASSFVHAVQQTSVDDTDDIAKEAAELALLALPDIGRRPYECPLATAVNGDLDRQGTEFATFIKKQLLQTSAAPGSINPPSSLGNRYDRDLYWSLAMSGHIRGMPCSLIKAGWWHYEFCWGRYIRQFHEELGSGPNPQGLMEVKAEFILGLGSLAVADDFLITSRGARYTDGMHNMVRKLPAKSELTPAKQAAREQAAQYKCTHSLDSYMLHKQRSYRKRPNNNNNNNNNNPTAAKTKFSKTALVSTMTYGTMCDLTGAGRETDIIMVCENMHVLFDWNITETRACHYTVFVTGRAVCSTMQQAESSISPSLASSSNSGADQQQQQSQRQDTTTPTTTTTTDSEDVTMPTRYTRERNGGGDVPTPTPKKTGDAPASPSSEPAPAEDLMTKEVFEQVMMGRRRPFSQKQQQQQQQEKHKQQQQADAMKSAADTALNAQNTASAAEEAADGLAAGAVSSTPGMTELQAEFFEEAMMFGLN